MINVTENFITFCDDMIIAEESLTLVDTTPDWMLKSNMKYNKTRHTYDIKMKSIYNSIVKVNSNKELTNDSELEKLISKILSLVNKSKPEIDKLIKNSLFSLAEEWEMSIKNSSELNKLINSLDNTLVLFFNENKYHVDLYINNSSRNANADEFFGNHCWVVYLNADSYDTNKLTVNDGGLNG